MSSSPTARVLIVDDDESIIAPLQHALEAAGYDVVIARDGTEALARVETHRPDVMVLDVVMPRRTGLAVLDKLSQSPREQMPRLILVSGHDDDRIRQFALSRGAARFVKKPYDVLEMVDLVGELAG